MYVYVCVYIYIYNIYTYLLARGAVRAWRLPLWRASWLRTHGVNANGAAARVVNFDGLGKKVRPGTFGKIKVN